MLIGESTPPGIFVTGTAARTNFDPDIAGVQLSMSFAGGGFTNLSSELFGPLFDGTPRNVYTPGFVWGAMVEYRPSQFFSVGIAAQLILMSHSESLFLNWTSLAWSVAPMARLHFGSPLIAWRTAFDVSLGIGIGFGRWSDSFLGYSTEGAFLAWSRTVESLTVPIELAFMVWPGGVAGIGAFGGVEIWEPLSHSSCSGMVATPLHDCSPRGRHTEFLWKLGLRFGGRF